MDAFQLNVYNALLNRGVGTGNGGGNAGGIAPAAADGAAVTSGKSYAQGAWAQLAAAATVTTDWWITHLAGNDLYFAASEEFEIQLGEGGAGAEVAATGSRCHFGHQEVTAAGQVMMMEHSYGAFPIFLPSGTRLAASSGAASANNRAHQVGVGFRSGLGS